MTGSTPFDAILASCREVAEPTPSDRALADALEARGARVRIRPWDAIATEHDAGRVVCLRSTWDYHRRPGEFREWIRRMASVRGRLWNPAGTVLWNMDKIYLRELAETGVRLPATRWFDPGSRPDVAAWMRDTGHTRAVIKPRISATAYGTHVMIEGATLDEEDWHILERSGSVIQSFVPEVQTVGELSLVFIDGQFSHAVRKRAAPGEFRVQMDFGGSADLAPATGEAQAFASAVLAAAAHPWIYARVDIVETSTGPILMELELIEPELFLHLFPRAAARLADALMRDHVPS